MAPAYIPLYPKLTSAKLRYTDIPWAAWPLLHQERQETLQRTTSRLLWCNMAVSIRQMGSQLQLRVPDNWRSRQDLSSRIHLISVQLNAYKSQNSYIGTMLRIMNQLTGRGNCAKWIQLLVSLRAMCEVTTATPPALISANTLMLIIAPTTYFNQIHQMSDLIIDKI